MRQLDEGCRAPVVLFVFNRPWHTRRTMTSLLRDPLAAESNLVIFSDGPRVDSDATKVASVRDYLARIDGFKSVALVNRDRNFGLSESVISGVTQVIQQHGRAIVVEDDLEFAPSFLTYMNEALIRYHDDQRIFSLGGYTPPVVIPPDYSEDFFLSYRCCTWGWATWRDRWDSVDWQCRDVNSMFRDQRMIDLFNQGGNDMYDMLRAQLAGKIDSWGIRWDYAHFKNKAFCFRPVRTLVKTNGMDGTGIHCGATDKFDVILTKQSEFAYPDPGSLRVNEKISDRICLFYCPRTKKMGFFAAIIRYMKTLVSQRFQKISV